MIANSLQDYYNDIGVLQNIGLGQTSNSSQPANQVSGYVASKEYDSKRKQKLKLLPKITK